MTRYVVTFSLLSVLLFSTTSSAQDDKWVEATQNEDQRVQKLLDAYSKGQRVDKWLQQAHDQNSFDREASYFQAIRDLVPSPYWIGVQCEPAGETSFYSKDLGGLLLKVKGGLKISHISKKSPAEAVDMQVGDIILFVEDKTVSAVNDLINVINEKNDSPLSGGLVREQKLREFTVTPAKRPVEDDLKTLKALENAQELSWAYRTGLPKDYAATITIEHGEQPEITIRKGDESWTCENGNVATLPKETRQFARSSYQSLSQLAPYRYLGNQDRWMNFSRGEYQNALQNYWFQKKETKVEDRLEGLQKQVEALAKAVGELRKEKD